MLQNEKLVSGAKAEYQDAFVLFSETKITNIQSIIPAIEMSHQVIAEATFKNAKC